MMHKDIAEEREFGILWPYFSCVSCEGSAKAAEGGRRAELVDFELDLLGEQFALEVCSWCFVSMCHMFALPSPLISSLTHNALACQSG
jgi:hypothetical protein